MVLTSTVAKPKTSGEATLRELAALVVVEVTAAAAAVATVNSEPNTEVTTPAPDVARVKALPPSLVMIVNASPPTAAVK